MTAQNRQKQTAIIIIKSTPNKESAKVELIKSDFTDEELANILIKMVDELIN